MRKVIALSSAIGTLAATACSAAGLVLMPGLYEIEVRIDLPNVQNAAAPMVLTRCVGSADVESGKTFFVLSDNPLKNCPLLDHQVTADTVTYRILCPGPNMGSAVGVFDFTGSAYRGSIEMNMGGKNMTMSGTQVGKRIGECPGAQ